MAIAWNFPPASTMRSDCNSPKAPAQNHDSRLHLESFREFALVPPFPWRRNTVPGGGQSPGEGTGSLSLLMRAPKDGRSRAYPFQAGARQYWLRGELRVGGLQGG